MTDGEVLMSELTARKMAHECPIYAPGSGAQNATYNATRSAATSAACGNRWMEYRNILNERGLTPLPLAREGLE